MKIVSSYKVEIIKANNIFRDTIATYQNAIAYLINVFFGEWDSMHTIMNTKTRFNYAEKLVHGTKNNIAKFPEFDKLFYKMPSYLRRAAIQSALGAISSYKSLLRNWEDNGKHGKEPKLQQHRNILPVFYKKQMFLETNDPCIVQLKLFCKNDWIWIPIKLLPTDIKYLKTHWNHIKSSAPTLEKHYGKYYLRFAFEENITLNNTPVFNQNICAIDLGINSDAVCNIMKSDGTIVARKFIDFPSDKDHLYHVLNRIKKMTKEHGYKSTHALWAYASRINKAHAIKIARAITNFAVEQNVSTIVFEHLDFKGHKSKNQKIHMWRKNDIQSMVEHNAHRFGIRISRICAWNTSALAFDGSGKLTRDNNNKQWATFSTGKRYNCDLSASYNIGARYFVREILKTFSETERSQLAAKVPEVERRTSVTLSTLWQLDKALMTT